MGSFYFVFYFITSILHPLFHARWPSQSKLYLVWNYYPPRLIRNHVLLYVSKAKNLCSVRKMYSFYGYKNLRDWLVSWNTEEFHTLYCFSSFVHHHPKCAHLTWLKYFSPLCPTHSLLFHTKQGGSKSKGEVDNRENFKRELMIRVRW